MITDFVQQITDHLFTTAVSQGTKKSMLLTTLGFPEDMKSHRSVLAFKVAATMTQNISLLGIIVHYRIWWKVWSKDHSYNFKFLVYPSFEKCLEKRDGEIKNM